jgi:hypothetical protein
MMIILTCTVKKILEDNGFKVDTFNDPILVLNYYKVNFYNLVILDIKVSKWMDLHREYRRFGNNCYIKYYIHNLNRFANDERWSYSYCSNNNNNTSHVTSSIYYLCRGRSHSNTNTRGRNRG